LNDTVAQLKLVYRNDANELHRRYEEVSKTLASWRAADRSEENNRRLEVWLRAAIRSSMPGSREPLPPLPEFETLPEAAPLVLTPAPERSLIPETTAAEPPTATTPTPITTPEVTQALSTPSAPAESVDANKPPTDGPTLVGNETPVHETEQAEGGETPASDQQPQMDDLPIIEDAPEVGELPDADELPEIEEDAATIEALGDPFIDDP
jgi:hypothetical protein